MWELRPDQQSTREQCTFHTAKLFLQHKLKERWQQRCAVKLATKWLAPKVKHCKRACVGTPGLSACIQPGHRVTFMSVIIEGCYPSKNM